MKKIGAYKSLFILIILFIVVGCQGAAPTSTSVPPTQPPPTAVPAAAPKPANTEVSKSAATPAPQATVAQSQPAQAQVTLEFPFPTSPGMPEGFAALIAAYKAKNPNITIKTSTAPLAAYQQNLLVMFSSNSTADIILPGAPEVQGFAMNGGLYPVDEILPTTQYSEFTNSSIDSVTYKGKMYAYPWRDSAIAMYYNIEYFEMAGVKVPKTLDEAWTWPQWLENIQKVVKVAEAKKGEKVWGTVFLNNPLASGTDFWIVPMMRSAGAKGSPTYNWISPDGTQVTGYADTPEALKAYHFFQDLYVAHKLAPQAEVQDAFGLGKAATWISFVQTGATLQTGFPNLKWGVMPLPYFVTPLTHTGGFTFAIPAKSKHPKEAMDFIKYMGSDEGVVTFYKAAGTFLPARKTIFDKYPDYFGKDWQQIFVQELIKWGISRPKSPGYTAYDSVLSAALKNIALGANVEDTIKAAVKDIDNQLKDFKK